MAVQLAQHGPERLLPPVEGEPVADTSLAAGEAQVRAPSGDRGDDRGAGEEFVEGGHDGVVKRARGRGDGAVFRDEVGTTRPATATSSNRRITW